MGVGWGAPGEPPAVLKTTPSPRESATVGGLVSCASRSEHSLVNSGDANAGGGVAAPPVRKLQFLGSFLGFGGAGGAVYNVSKCLRAPRSARTPSAKPLRFGGAIG